MSSIEKKQLDALCSNPDVRFQAEGLLHKARSRTAPGSGYDIGNGKTGLAAICAYLASKDAGYDDVVYNVAQTTSCLDKKVFSKTLKTVTAALKAHLNTSILAPHPSTPHKAGTSTRRPPAYLELLTQHDVSAKEAIVAWMETAEKTLMTNQAFLKNYTLAPGSTAVRLAVFVWVARMITSRVKSEPLTAQYGVPMNLHSRLVETVQQACPGVEADIKKAKSNQAGGRSSTRGTTTPANPPATTRRAQAIAALMSPTKSALRNSQSTTPSEPRLKRKLTFQTTSDAEVDEDDGVFAPDSPSKRQRRSSPYKTPHTPLARDVYNHLEMPIPPAALIASSSKVALDSDSDVEMAPAARIESTPASATASRSLRRSAYRSAPEVPVVDPLAVLSDDGDNAGEDGAVEAGVSAQEDEEAEDGQEEDEEEMLPLARRFRPVLIDRAQWAARAPTLTKQWSLAEKEKQMMLKTWAHPFEWMRLQTIGATG
ncbi:hypothetical protein OF83DRAFT_1087762 [Amylostereum chailletii]|nr:hypothetical protein OF83DRAFT_1087762 [Amylostereum chailletii]